MKDGSCCSLRYDEHFLSHSNRDMVQAFALSSHSLGEPISAHASTKIHHIDPVEQSHSRESGDVFRIELFIVVIDDVHDIYVRIR